MDQLNELWSQGSYSRIARNYLPMAGRLVERVDVTEGETVLDIGCGTGSVAITAARRGGRVSGVDITPEMLAEAQRNAETADVEGIEWREGDAVDLPFEDDSFDVTLSSLGHMYGDPPDASTRELLRVTRPGGRFGFTSWTPSSIYPTMAALLMAQLDPADLPGFTEPPFMWGDEDVVIERLGPEVDVDVEVETVSYPTLSPGHFWRETASHSGLFEEFLERVDDARREKLREQMLETIARRYDPVENAVTMEYLRTTGTVPD